MVTYNSIYEATGIESIISSEMQNAIKLWYDVYRDNAPWLNRDVKSLNIANTICSEIARCTTIEMKSQISAKSKVQNKDIDFLNENYKKVLKKLREQLEKGEALGGMIIRPFVSNNEIYFDFNFPTEYIPLAFDEDTNITEIIFIDTYFADKHYYTRLEHHKLANGVYTISNSVYKSKTQNVLGNLINISEVEKWKNISPEVTINNITKPLFGYYRVPTANTIEINSPFGMSIFGNAVNLIKEADKQYSRLLWEFEGGELAIDADETAIRATKAVQDANGNIGYIPETAQLRQRLFRGLNSGEDTYHVFNPALRDTSILNGLNAILCRIEDVTGIARGTLSNVVYSSSEARTATELRMLKQRTYATVADNQMALQKALDDLVYAINAISVLYNLINPTEYEISYEWDDSIITDTQTQLDEQIKLYNIGVLSDVEIRMWYKGETEEQAKMAVNTIREENPTVEQILGR